MSDVAAIAEAVGERLGLPREPRWERVLEGLAPLPVRDGLYLLQEGLGDTYTRWNWEHPALLGAMGMLPGEDVDVATMRWTVRQVLAWGVHFYTALGLVLGAAILVLLVRG